MGRGAVVQNFSAVAGACLALRRSTFEEVGGFDESNLPSVYHDVDLCLRLGERGYRILWTPYAELRCLQAGRQEESSAGSRSAQREYLNSRWAALLRDDPYYNPNLTLEREDFSLAWPPRAEKPWE